MTTLEQALADYQKRHELQDSEMQVLRGAFLDGYEAGHAAASKHCLSSIAKALTPPKGFLE